MTPLLIVGGIMLAFVALEIWRLIIEKASSAHEQIDSPIGGPRP